MATNNPIEVKLLAALSSLPSDWVVMAETQSNVAVDTTIAAIHMLTAKKNLCIIVSANRPYANLVAQYKNAGIDPKYIFIIDCVTRKNGGKALKASNAVFVDNSSALTNILIQINECTRTMKGKKVLLIDSVTTLLVYNKPDVLARFVHSTLTHIRSKGVNGFLVCLSDETDKEVKAEISQLCDKVITSAE
ncbi:MAG: ATPase domain-containing protein [Candidatus Micrarchaeia archaeon]